MTNRLLITTLMLGLLCLSAYAAEEDAPSWEGYALTVRKITPASGIAEIEPSYQFVVGEPGPQKKIRQAPQWEVPKAEAPVMIVAAPQAKPHTPEAPKFTGQQPTQSPATTAPSAPPKTRQIQAGVIGFQFDSDKLTEKARTLLDQSVDEIRREKPEQISIIGHTDSLGGQEYNQYLSERRAENVFQYLKSKGIAISNIARTGFGEDRPLSDNHTAKGRAANRRVEIVLTLAWTEGN